MAKLSVEEFVEFLRKSELTSEDRLNTALKKIRETANKENIANADYVAGALVKLGVITHWHVRQLMKRKYKGFYLRQYRILDHIGSGGMSTVYLAEHTLMHRFVAIKVLPKKRLANSAYLDRFVREAQAIASLDHPHIVRAYDIDRYEDIHYIVMEYFEGNNLRQIVDKEGPLPYEDAVNYIRQGAEGLIHAHRIGIIHRDVKPENLLANAQGLVKLLDLGLALLDEDVFQQPHSSVSSDKILGTADYLAPEQAIDSNKIDARADIYSLGCTLYFCLTGHPPFPFGTIPQRLLAHQKEMPASILLDRPDAPDDLVAICNKMMNKRPEDRFQSASEVVEVLGLWLIHHGFAEPQELGMTLKDENEKEDENFFENRLSFLDDPWSATGLGDGKEEARLSNTGIGNEEVVNLFGSTAGSQDGGGNDSNSSRFNREDFLNQLSSKGVLLPQRLREKTEEGVDPIELAMSEIKTERRSAESSISLGSEDASASGSSLRRNNLSGGDGNTENSKNPSHGGDMLFLSPERQNAVKTSNEKETIHGWYRQVPFWFWVVFFSGYVLATFLAGILFAILLNK